MASTKPNHLPKAPSPNTITLGVGLQHVDLGPALHPQLPLVGRLHGCWRRQCERQHTKWQFQSLNTSLNRQDPALLNHISPPDLHFSSTDRVCGGWGRKIRWEPPRPEQTLLLPSEGLLLSRKTSFTSLLPPKLYSPELKFRSAGRESVFDLARSTQTHSATWEAHRHWLRQNS